MNKTRILKCFKNYIMDGGDYAFYEGDDYEIETFDYYVRAVSEVSESHQLSFSTFIELFTKETK